MKSNLKIVTLTALQKKLPSLRRKNKIAFTNGCFDILHFGHVSYLKKAKGQGRILVLGLNSDISIKKIKGPKRPIVDQKYRAGLLAALECVDFIVIFNEDTPEKLIKAVNPDILIKGEDWRGKEVAGAEFVKANGGKLELIKYISGLSTTEIIKKIKKNY